MKRLILIALFSLLSVFTLLAVQQVGVLGIFEHQFKNFAGMQVLLDLVIACVLIIVWLIDDAKKNGRSPWPWIALTLAAGSFGPLLYLLTSKKAK